MSGDLFKYRLHFRNENELILNNRLLFFISVSLAVILRLITLASYETWGDEKLSVSEANGMLEISLQKDSVFFHKDFQNNNNLKNVLRSVQKGDGGNGVLYITTLHFWTIAFGNSDFSVRLLSVLLGTMVIVLIYMLCSVLFENKKIALLAMFFASVHPHLITYSQEARAYTMAMLFCMIATLKLIQIIQANGVNYWDYAFYSISVLCAFLSHFSTVYVFAAHLVIGFIYRSDLDRNKIKMIIPFSLFIFITLFLWYYLYGKEGLKLISERNLTYQKLSIQDPYNSFYGEISPKFFLGGLLQNLLYFSGNTLQDFGFKILFLSPLLSIPYTLVFLAVKKSIRYNKRILALLLLSFSSLLYAVFLAFVSGHIISFQTSYAIFSTPFFIVLFAFSISVVKINRIAAISLLFHLIIVLVSTFSIYCGMDSHTKNANGFEATAKIINAEKQTDIQNITYNDAYDALELNKYLNASSREIKQHISPLTDCKILLQKSNQTICLK